MADLLTAFRNFISREQLFSHDDQLLLACSGGLDSTVLAHLLHAEGYNFAIAHMNFQLRGEASDGDAAFVEDLARTLGAKFYCKAVDVKAEAEDGESTQMTARRLRYEWFENIRSSEKFDRILTAHHLDDNFETLLLNLIRGTGIAGLSGIKPRLGSLTRPLLEIPRSSLEEFAKTGKFSWREDESNKKDDYLRNKIRHRLVPTFKDEFALSDKTVSLTFSNLRGTRALYNHHLRRERDRRQKINGAEISIEREFGWEYSQERAFLWFVIKAYGFTIDQVEQILKSQSGRFYDSSEHRLFVQDSKWIISPLPTAPPLQGLEIHELPNGIAIGKAGLIEISMVSRPETLSSNNVLYLAPPSLPLHLRPRKNGDRFQPLGMNGKTKKVQDYFVDQKIPVWLRDRIYLLVNDDDEIMAIPGYCISEKFKVKPTDEKVLAITTF